MKNSLLGLLLFFGFVLSGCSYVPTKIGFPDVPDLLMEPCPELLEINKNETRMSEFLKVVNKNYATYYECEIRLNLFQKWYKEQKDAYKEITK